MQHINRCFTALRPELNGDSISVAEKVEIVLSHVGDLVNTLGEQRVCDVLHDIITDISVPRRFVATAENKLPEVDGSNVDHEIHMDEIEREVTKILYPQTPL